MRRNVLRYMGWIGIIVLLAALTVTGCTRSKSSGPPESTQDTSGAQSATQPAAQATATQPLSGQEALDATTTAWAQATAEAASPDSGGSSATEEPTATTAGQEPADTATPAPPATTAPEATPAATEEAEPTKAPEPTAPPVAGEERTHVVQPGENLYRISLNYGLDYRDVMAYNGITNPNMIYVGQTIKIPPSGDAPPSTKPEPPSSGGSGKTHVVQPGENLFRIALQYNMMYTTLAAANNLSYPYTIYTGQVLIIP